MRLRTEVVNLPRRSSYYVPPSAAKREYDRLIATGMEAKEAAKQAQERTGLSIRTGKPMKTRGYGWQKL
jgi:hypothetical protein